MYHNTISWMIAGGEREESREDRRLAQHRIALRDSRIAMPPVRSRWPDRIAGFAGWVRPADPTTLDCCAA